MRALLLLLALVLMVSGCAHATGTLAEGCDGNAELQTQRSTELLALLKEDQVDRSGPYDAIDFTRVNPRDLQRRIKVAGIFAEGCFHNPSDYAAAAMIFQHGTTADHYYQAFLWANEAVRLGDNSQRWLTAAGLDRYLVKRGRKQLFGTQFGKDVAGKFCLQPVEPTFPESRRIEFLKATLKESVANTLKGIGANQTPRETKLCVPPLEPSPRGTVPGFW